MAPRGKRRPEKTVRFEQSEDTFENDKDEAENDEDKKGEDEFTLDDVLRLGGTKVKLRVSSPVFCLSPRGNLGSAQL